MQSESVSELGVLSTIATDAPSTTESDGILPNPPWRDIAMSWFQRFCGQLFLLPFAGLLVFLMRVWRGYRIEDLQALRRQYRELTKDARPLLICANHLTFIDSALMIWAFGANGWYLFRFRAFSWNLPAGDFFKKKVHFRIVAFLSKCLFIHRDGTKEHKNGVLALCRYWLLRGDVVSLFPEGRRSRTGRFDRERITFGVGKLLAATPQCRVLCVYLRGDKQRSFSSYPARGSRIRLLTQLFEPRTEQLGRHAYHALASQVAGALAGLEMKYVEKYGALPSPPPKPVAEVTGGSSGSGLALARELAGSGHDLVIVARDAVRLEALAAEAKKRFGAEVLSIVADLSTREGVQTVVDDLALTKTAIDLLVNNAGFAVHGRFAETPLERELQLVATQLLASLQLTKAVLPGMRARGRGAILNVGSVYAFSPVPQQAVYAACKAFLQSFSESLASETRGVGVRVVNVCPGVTQTEFRRRAGLRDKGKGQSAEEVAKFALKALQRRGTVAVPGLANRLFVAAARLLSGQRMAALMNVINGARGVNG